MTSPHWRRSRRLAITALAAALTVVAAARPAAHPLGTTVVSIAAAEDQTLRVTILAEAAPLVAKLRALAGADAATIPSAPEALAAGLRELQQTLIANLAINVDDAPAAVRWRQVSVAADGQATIELLAVGPAHGQRVSWRCSFIFGSYPVVVRGREDRDAVQWLQGTQTSAPVEWRRTQPGGSAARAFRLGFTHIVPNGIDHILFVLGLFLLSTRPRQVLAQVSAFTLAHSITLGLTLYGVLSLPAGVVEPLIALSVAYVGIENLITSQLKPWRVAIVFGFGLLHGMGFAEALAGLHLARHQFLSTLVSFNVGVEAGQLAVIGVAAIGLALVTRSQAAWRRPLTRLASAAIGVFGLLWTIERLI